jgi:general secretion pathway protein K
MTTSGGRNAVRTRKRRRDRRGVALILVLGAITVLTVMLTEFQDDTSSDLAAALADRDALKAEYLAKSGVELSRLLLAAEPTIQQAIKMSPFGLFLPRTMQIPIWEYADGVLGAFNDKDGTDAFQRLTGTDLSQGKNLGIEGGSFAVKIIDEDSKLNINLGASPDSIRQLRLATQLLTLTSGEQYRTMFEQRDRDDQFSDRATICGAIIDWADPDENMNPCDTRSDAPVSAGSEDAFYQMLKYPYWRKNAAYDSLDELHLVRGISDDFWATFVDPDPTNPRKRVMTVWGQTKVNVNSAAPQTLLALVCGYAVNAKMCTDVLQAATFLQVVGLFQNMFAGFPVFLGADGFANVMQGKASPGSPIDMSTIFKAVGLEPVSAFKPGFKDALTVRSDVFSIYADGIVPGYQRKTRVRIHAVVDRRGTPAPTYMQPLGTQGTAATGMPGQMPTPAATATAGTPGTTATSGTQGSAIPWATQPDPGGTVVYYRQE